MVFCPTVFLLMAGAFYASLQSSAGLIVEMSEMREYKVFSNK